MYVCYATAPRPRPLPPSARPRLVVTPFQSGTVLLRSLSSTGRVDRVGKQARRTKEQYAPQQQGRERKHPCTRTLRPCIPSLAAISVISFLTAARSLSSSATNNQPSDFCLLSFFFPSYRRSPTVYRSASMASTVEGAVGGAGGEDGYGGSNGGLWGLWCSR